MKLSNFKKFIGMLILGLTVMLGVGSLANAQDDRNGSGRNYNNGQDDRYRIRRGGKYYNTNRQGADLLRQAVNEGYRRGFDAGRDDRSSRRRNNWKKNSVYRSADTGYESYVDRRQYQYYFQQGFQKGYDDGFHSRNRYGSDNNMLGGILNKIFRAESY